MGLRIREVGKKWLITIGFAFDEIDGLVGDLSIDRLTLVATVHCQFLWCFTSLRRHDVGEHGIRVTIWREAIAIRPEGPV